jgi:hypothetical protein
MTAIHGKLNERGGMDLPAAMNTTAVRTEHGCFAV